MCSRVSLADFVLLLIF